MATSNREAIETALFGVKELQKAFFLERMVFISGAVAALVLLVVIAVLMIIEGNVATTNWVSLFGSGGLFMATGSGAMLYFGKAFELLRSLAERQNRGH